MKDNKYLSKYRIDSSRAQWHDYNAGYYFVTICTSQRIHYFGEIVSSINNGSLLTNRSEERRVGKEC